MTVTLAGSPQPTATVAPKPVTPRVPVLIVDDNASKRLALKGILAPSGHEIIEADSGIAALRCLLERDFAVILLDVRMPVMDGYTTALMIRKRKNSETTPIIFITAYDRDEVAEADGYALGAVDFIFAPVRPLDLRSKVNVFASLFVQTEALAAQVRDVKAIADELRVLTDAAPIGIFQTDADHRYVYTNPGWSEITGVSVEEALGAKWHSIISADDRDALLAGMPNTNEFSSRFQIVRPDLALRTVVLTWRSIPDANSGGSGSVGTLADVTAEAKAEATMERARDAALAAIVMQRQFTASASHELKTPLTSILGFCEEIVDNDALTTEDAELLGIVHRNALRLSRLVDDLLVVGQDEIDATMMRLEPTYVAGLVERVINNFTAEAQQSEITLVGDNQALTARAMADPLRLEQALTNLVSNAMKFTPNGGQVTIEICSNGSDVDIRVIDNGAGIESADTDRIFDRFYRAQTAVDGAVIGSGLGLAIAKGMIEAQDGSIAVDSKPGHGSTFTISLPAVHDERVIVANPDCRGDAVPSGAAPRHDGTPMPPSSSEGVGFDGR